MECEERDLWEYLPDTVWLHVFSFLRVHDIISVRKVCVRWSILGIDEMLWKRLLFRDFHIAITVDKPPGSLWSREYRRLCDDVPLVPTETLEVHSDQVLHVSFSHDGTMFATASKDGTVAVWDATRYPVKKKYRMNMSLMSWKYPHFTQFNSSDTLLLVSGVHFGSLNNTSGEIAVITLQFEFALQCRVANKPVDTFGCWIGDRHLVSSELHWLAHYTSLSLLWINRASQEPESEHIPVIKQLYRLYNANASTVRTIMVANNKVRTSTTDQQRTETVETNDTTASDPEETRDSLTICYTQEYYTNNQNNDETFDADREGEEKEFSERDTSEPADLNSEESSDPADQDVMDRKLLIYTCGDATYTPHTVCFKYIENVRFPKHLHPGPPIQERIAARQRQKETAGDGPDWTDYESVKYMFDEPDHVIDVLGHVVGMALSPDQRYLYVNVQTWPPGYVIESPMKPPPLSHLLSMQVVDLNTLRVVGSLPRLNSQYSHVGHYIFLDVAEHFVASGAEGVSAYVWSRHYGVALAVLRHLDVVNAVAFSPTSGMMVTVSDDYSIRVWRSKRDVRKIGLRADRFDSSKVTLCHRERPCKLCDSPPTDIIDLL